jgi:hypothetical protein
MESGASEPRAHVEKKTEPTILFDNLISAPQQPFDFTKALAREEELLRIQSCWFILPSYLSCKHITYRPYHPPSALYNPHLNQLYSAVEGRDLARSFYLLVHSFYPPNPSSSSSLLLKTPLTSNDVGKQLYPRCQVRAETINRHHLTISKLD